MTYLLDASVLIALAVTDHLHHPAADAWLTDMDDRFATCPITEGSLVRLLIRDGQSATTVSDYLAAVHADRRHVFWPDTLSYRAVPLSGVVGHRQVTDAYLAQLARDQGGRLITLDQGLAKTHGDVADLVPPLPPSPRAG